MITDRVIISYLFDYFLVGDNQKQKGLISSGGAGEIVSILELQTNNHNHGKYRFYRAFSLKLPVSSGNRIA